MIDYEFKLNALKFFCPNGFTDNGVEIKSSDPVPSKEELDKKIAELKAAYPLKELREKRNVLLAESDWTGLSDSALTNEQAAKWKLYRQKLRDLPGGLNTEFKVKNVKWPTAPG